MWPLLFGGQSCELAIRFMLHLGEDLMHLASFPCCHLELACAVSVAHGMNGEAPEALCEGMLRQAELWLPLQSH